MDSTRRTDRSGWAASSKQPAASGCKWPVVGGQQGGDIACLSIGHGRCCFVVLLGCQPLTDGICDDVLDVVEGIAREAVIKLTQEKKGLEKEMVQTRKCIIKKESGRCDVSGN